MAPTEKAPLCARVLEKCAKKFLPRVDSTKEMTLMSQDLLLQQHNGPVERTHMIVSNTFEMGFVSLRYYEMNEIHGFTITDSELKHTMTRVDSKVWK